MRRYLLTALAVTILMAGPALASPGDQNSQAVPAGSDSMVVDSSMDAAGGGSSDAGTAASDKWRFSVTPIAAWAFNVKGPMTVLGNTRYVNASWGDVTSNLNSAGGLGFSFGKGAWTGMASISTLKWEVDNVGSTLDPTEYNFKLQYTIGQLGFGYRLPVAPGPKAPNVQLLAFVRSSQFKFSVAPSAGGPDLDSRSRNWTDPFIGMSVSQPIKGKFGAEMMGDIGGFGISSNQSQLTWDFKAGVGYTWMFEKGWGMNLAGGYQAQQFFLQNENDPEVSSADFRMQGPYLNLRFAW